MSQNTNTILIIWYSFKFPSPLHTPHEDTSFKKSNCFSLLYEKDKTEPTTLALVFRREHEQLDRQQDNELRASGSYKTMNGAI